MMLRGESQQSDWGKHNFSFIVNIFNSLMILDRENKLSDYPSIKRFFYSTYVKKMIKMEKKKIIACLLA